jgi:CRISPR-associated protein (TIGR02584 family)
MSLVFLTTLGMRPQAITVALDKLQEQYRYDAVGILHTDPENSGIANALRDLKVVLGRDYPHIRADYHNITQRNGTALHDLTDQDTARDYMKGVGKVLIAYGKQHYRVHLLVAGGRKAMSIYGMVAANLVFTSSQDQVFTVLSSDDVLGREEWHVPANKRHEVKIVKLPMVPSRLLPGADPTPFFDNIPSARAEFMSKLTTEEKALTGVMRNNPYLTNDEWAGKLQKSPKTINNQLTGIYSKMMAYYTMAQDVDESARRLVLLDILREEE